MAKTNKVNGLLYVYQEMCEPHDSPIFPAVIIQSAHESTHVLWCGIGAHVVTSDQKILKEIAVADSEDVTNV